MKTQYHEVYQNHDSQLLNTVISFWNLTASARTKEHNTSLTAALWQKYAVKQGEFFTCLSYPDMNNPTARSNKFIILCDDFTVFVDLHKYLNSVINTTSRKFNQIKLADVKEVTVSSKEGLTLKDVTGRLVFAMIHETETLRMD
jgi:hypothetical protein